jgi:hypothetical protein
LLIDRKVKKAELADKTSLAIKKAYNYLVDILKDRQDLAEWLDRDVSVIQNEIGLQYNLLPFLVTSRSKDKLVDIKERFGLKTIKEMRLEVLNKALALVEIEIDEWCRKNGYVREEWLTEDEQEKSKEKLKRLFENLKKSR